MNVPPPNLKGNYEYSCMSCLQEADTGLILRGEPEWVASFLIAQLGIETDVATQIVEDYMVDPDDITIPLCESCAEEAGVNVAAIIPGAELPGYIQT